MIKYHFYFVNVPLPRGVVPGPPSRAKEQRDPWSWEAEPGPIRSLAENRCLLLPNRILSKGPGAEQPSSVSSRDREARSFVNVTINTFPLPCRLSFLCKAWRHLIWGQKSLPITDSTYPCRSWAVNSQRGYPVTGESGLLAQRAACFSLCLPPALLVHCLSLK